MTKLTGLMKDETVICTMKVSKKKPACYFLLAIIIPSLVLLYALLGFKERGFEFVLVLTMAISLFLILIYYFISNVLLVLNTTYRLTNKRIICDQMVNFKRKSQSFYYKVVKDIEIVKFDVLRYSHIRFILEKANVYKEQDNDCTFFAINQNDVNMIVSCLNKYANVSIENK